MPVIKSAIKKLRKDKRRTIANDVFRTTLSNAIRKATKSKKAVDIQNAFSLVDKASKKHLMHANRASRIKSRLAKNEMPSAKTPKVAGKPAKSIRSSKKKSVLASATA